MGLGSALVFTTIFSAEAAKSSNSGSGLTSLLFFAAIFGAMYFLILRPQRKRQKEAVALQRSIVEGDEVMTRDGIYGFVTAFDKSEEGLDIAWLDIAEVGNQPVEIRVLRSALARKVKSTTDAAPEEGNSSK